MKTIKLKIKTNSNNYSILIGTNLLTKIPLIVKRNLIKFDKCLIIFEKKIPKKKYKYN